MATGEYNLVNNRKFIIREASDEFMNRRNFINNLGIGLLAFTSIKLFGEVNDNWIPVLVADNRNTNDRIYPLKIVENIRDQIQFLIDKRQCFVSLCDDIETLTESVSLQKVSGLIDDVKIESGVLYVKWHLLKTPSGEVVKTCGKDLYMVSSGLGSIKGNVVSNDYEFIQFIISPNSSWEGQFKQRLV